MKAKHLAVLISVCCPMPALAQTSITIYGIADAGIQASRFGNGTQYNLASGMTGAHILVDGGRTASPASVTTVAR